MVYNCIKRNLETIINLTRLDFSKNEINHICHRKLLKYLKSLLLGYI